MSNTDCQIVRAWLLDPSTDAHLDALTAELVAHVAGCAACRGGLAAALAAHGADLGAAELDSCAGCQDDLAAYLELELARGAAAAARRYPHVWAHLWICQNCAESYQMLAALAAAEAAGELDPLPAPVRAAEPEPVALVRLARDFLHQLFAPQIALGAAWQGEGDDLLIAEEDLPGCRVTIAVRQTDPARWEIEITVVPPVAGRAVVSFGERRYHAPLQPDGSARIVDIPTALLVDRTGPDMLIAVEHRVGDECGG